MVDVLDTLRQLHGALTDSLDRNVILADLILLPARVLLVGAPA